MNKKLEEKIAFYGLILFCSIFIFVLLLLIKNPEKIKIIIIFSEENAKTIETILYFFLGFTVIAYIYDHKKHTQRFCPRCNKLVRIKINSKEIETCPYCGSSLIKINEKEKSILNKIQEEKQKIETNQFILAFYLIGSVVAIFWFKLWKGNIYFLLELLIFVIALGYGFYRFKNKGVENNKMEDRQHLSLGEKIDNLESFIKEEQQNKKIEIKKMTIKLSILFLFILVGCIVIIFNIIPVETLDKLVDKFNWINLLIF
jgi:DNA-directed RNA polymerase subunit M/transcription elongation factor TFIIS